MLCCPLRFLKRPLVRAGGCDRPIRHSSSIWPERRQSGQAGSDLRHESASVLFAADRPHVAAVLAPVVGGAVHAAEGGMRRTAPHSATCGGSRPRLSWRGEVGVGHASGILDSAPWVRKRSGDVDPAVESRQRRGLGLRTTAIPGLVVCMLPLLENVAFAVLLWRA